MVFTQKVPAHNFMLSARQKFPQKPKIRRFNHMNITFNETDKRSSVCRELRQWNFIARILKKMSFELTNWLSDEQEASLIQASAEIDVAVDRHHPDEEVVILEERAEERAIQPGREQQKLTVVPLTETLCRQHYLSLQEKAMVCKAYNFFVQNPQYGAHGKAELVAEMFGFSTRTVYRVLSEATVKDGKLSPQQLHGRGKPPTQFSTEQQNVILQTIISWNRTGIPVTIRKLNSFASEKFGMSLTKRSWREQLYRLGCSWGCGKRIEHAHDLECNVLRRHQYVLKKAMNRDDEGPDVSFFPFQKINKNKFEGLF